MTNHTAPKEHNRAATFEQTCALTKIICASLNEDQAQDVITINMNDKLAFTDIIVIASGRSQRHVNAIAEHLIERLKVHGHKNIRIEGVPNCDWVLIDMSDVVVHIFRPPVRAFYNLEKMWDVSPPSRETLLNDHASSEPEVATKSS